MRSCLKELDAQLRLAKETTAAKRACAGEASAAARMKKLEFEGQRKDTRQRLEDKKRNLLYVQQHLAAALVADARRFLQDSTHGVAREAAIRLHGDKYRKGKSPQMFCEKC